MTKAAFATILAILPAAAQTSVEALLEQKTLARLEQIDHDVPGAFGVAALDLTSGRVLQIHGDTVFAQASSIKIPILARAFQAVHGGELALANRVTLAPEEAVGGSGHLQDRLKQGPVTLTLEELLTLMIRDSDNTATNKVIAIVGMERVNRLMDEFRLPNTRLRRVMMDSAAAAADRENTSTPLEMARLAEMIYRGRAVSAESSTAMIGILKLVKGAVREAVPANVEVASKTGEVPGVFTETAIVFLPQRPFVLSAMAAGLPADAKNPIGAAAAALYAHFETLAHINRYGHRAR
jgi:beta-lactamase class A